MSALLDTVLHTIRTRRDEIEARYGIRLLGVVGSVARGEERPDSDVDIVFRTGGGTTLFALVDAEAELEAAISRRIDLVDSGGMKPAARAYMERDLVVA